MKKLFSVLMVVCLLTITLGVFTVSTMAETEVVVWEGDIYQEITTSHMIGVINVDSLTQAIRDDVAQNGTATKYVLTSTGSYYVGGESDYAEWGFYQEDPQYVEARANNGSSLSEATWTNTTELSKMGSGAFLCVATDGTDTVYVGHIKLIATHVPMTTTTEEEEPTATGTKPTATPSIRPTQVRDGVTQVYKFTFEDVNATSILKVGDEVVGEVVEWPEGSGNHCLRYQLNGETRNDGECHPYLWPEGIGESLCAQGDLAESGSQIELKIDVACSNVPLGSYLWACLIFNDLWENPADRRNDIVWPGNNQFNTGVVTWSSYQFGAPEEGYANGGIGFYDDRTLPDGVYMYIDNVEFNWIGKWIELDKTFVGYPGGILCEESDMELVAPTNPTATGTETVTGTETATSASATETATETATSASATETATETATATETSASATETTTEAEPTATETETSASETETSASESETSASETETSASESETSASETETSASVTVTEPAATETEPETGILGDANGDGAVNMKDVLLARKYLADIEVEINLDAADVNEDGSVNMKDILDMRKFLAELIDHFGA